MILGDLACTLSGEDDNKRMQHLVRVTDSYATRVLEIMPSRPVA
jgi:hypothetical protein